MPAKKAPPHPYELAQPRAIERIRPGQWFELDYTTDDDPDAVQHVWVRVGLSLEFVRRSDNAKVIELRGIDTDGDSAEFRQYKGFGMRRTLTEAQARRCGLVIPDPPQED